MPRYVGAVPRPTGLPQVGWRTSHRRRALRMLLALALAVVTLVATGLVVLLT